MKLRKKAGITLVGGGEAFEQSFTALRTVPFKMRIKSVLCAAGKVSRPIIERQKRRVANDPDLPMRFNSMFCYRGISEEISQFVMNRISAKGAD